MGADRSLVLVKTLGLLQDMWKRNFEAATNLTALKKSAVQSCGQEFITELNRQGLHAKDDEFWQAVNNKLNIPANAHTARQQREGEERERQEQERIEREATEKHRLLEGKKQVRKQTRNDWEIAAYELPDSELFGKKFIGVAKKESSQIEENTGFYDTLDRAYSSAYGLADSLDCQEQREIEFQRRYRVLKPLYLAAIYLTASLGDEFIGNYGERSPREPEAKQQFYLEHFVGVNSYKGFDSSILGQLEKEGMLKYSTTGRSLTINKAAVRQAIEAAQQMNIPGMEELLNDKAIHLECLDYQNRYEQMWEESEEYMDEE
jgi:hypothetical protein